MKLEIFSMFDHKAEAFIPPFYLPNIQMALRTVRDTGKDLSHMFGKHPMEYSLYHLGTWTDHNAEFELHEMAKTLGLVGTIVEEYDVRSIVPGVKNAKVG